MSDYYDRVISYRASMSMFHEMLEQGIISKDDYREISKMLTEKYQLDPSTIFEDIT